MKLYLIAVLFLAALVVVPCLAEDEKPETAKDVADSPETSEDNVQKPPGSTEGDQPEQGSNLDEAKEDSEKIPEEFQDEVEQSKRGLPQLSRYSCLILKRYGYCRVAAIARFCVKVCRGPPCNDKLSSLSCRRVRYTYKTCNHHIGRVYCRRTCRHCGVKPLPAQCKRHRTINDKSRRQSYVKPKNFLRCDSNIAEGWYRFVGGQGTYIPNRCVPSNRCGTHASGWLVGNYPTIHGQTVTRQVCFNWNKNCCYNAKFWKIYIQVTNCRSFYVFYLRKPKACHYRYCGNA